MLIEFYICLMYLLLFLWVFIIMDSTSPYIDCFITSLPEYLLGLFALIIYELYYLNY